MIFPTGSLPGATVEGGDLNRRRGRHGRLFLRIGGCLIRGALFRRPVARILEGLTRQSDQDEQRQQRQGSNAHVHSFAIRSFTAAALAAAQPPRPPAGRAGRPPLLPAREAPRGRRDLRSAPAPPARVRRAKPPTVSRRSSPATS